METSDYARAIEPNSRWQNVIIVTSVLIPIVVAILIYLPYDARIASLDVSFLPHLNAFLNSATALCLIVSLWAILNKKVRTHKMANITAFVLSSIFLISYVVFHYAAPPTLYGDINHDGLLSEAERVVATGRGMYIGLLLSHILLAAGVVPLVLFSMYYSLSGQFEKHRFISRITWPIWFYVAVTGVVVYALISPYYPS